MLRDGHMPAEAIAPVVNLPGCMVISSACGGGAEAMGEAFVHNGKIEVYIGCRVLPHGTDMTIFLVNYFFYALRKKLSDREAWNKAILVVDNPAIYKISFFHADGTVEHFDPDKQVNPLLVRS